MVPRPKPWAKKVFEAPSWFYARGWGWLLGRRFCEVEHVGRKSGRRLTTVLEIVIHDPTTDEIVVASAYGATANWYRNLQEHPATKIKTGRQEYRPQTRFLTPEEGRSVAERFRDEHPWEARVGLRVMDAIDAVPAGTFDDPVEMFASFPMVAFRPAEPAVL
ncbi:nitroreductase family deazaflavin-dependent oxidoreductase [Actinotalea sp. M2MS4P-6]|uniref:nitroreductase family deazaflavin-dependent oxidoreductase n=1 Tax=Actinotalea sp. M2MS4P-6 TaxID=2983762 RepID=UPI0021E4D4B1|nr:nitroreductase family deazaflavin-dependent oxidoreductase [Actinotalea sp. M2MS4P-6]MCV2394823.1 nitroreductase family deazaflavin-dependent oxidoreductase [Actinotalea sp. M2MS4P-6]